MLIHAQPHTHTHTYTHPPRSASHQQPLARKQRRGEGTSRCVGRGGEAREGPRGGRRGATPQRWRSAAGGEVVEVETVEKTEKIREWFIPRTGLSGRRGGRTGRGEGASTTWGGEEVSQGREGSEGSYGGAGDGAATRVLGEGRERGTEGGEETHKRTGGGGEGAGSGGHTHTRGPREERSAREEKARSRTKEGRASRATHQERGREQEEI